MSRCGTADTHCCWLGKAGKCRYVESSDLDGFKWKCSLRSQVNSWDEVYLMEEYKNNVKPYLIAVGYSDTDCGDWPPKGLKCNDCGEIG